MDTFPVLGILLLGVIGVMAMICVISLPRTALASGVFLVLLASTSFRNRDPSASLRSEMDTQVFFELGVYVFVALIVLRIFLLLPRFSLRMPTLGLLLVGYLTVAMLSSLWAPTPQFSFVRVTQITILFAYAIVAVAVFGPRQILGIASSSIIVYVLLSAAVAMIFPWANNTQGEGGLTRFAWFAAHPIAVGSIAAIASLFLLARVLFSGERTAWWSFGLPVWVHLLPLVTILLATRSRGPIFAFAFPAIVLLLRKYVIGYRPVRTPAALLVLFLAAGLAVTSIIIGGTGGDEPPGAVTSFLLRGQTTDQFTNLTGRTALWQHAFALFAEAPILGHGYMAARSVLMSQVHWGGHAHNGLIESLLSIGIVGAVLLWVPLLFILGSSFLHMLSNPPPTIHLQAVIFGVSAFLLLSSLTGTGFSEAPSVRQLLVFLFVFVHAAHTSRYMNSEHSGGAVPSTTDFSFARSREVE